MSTSDAVTPRGESRTQENAHKQGLTCPSCGDRWDHPYYEPCACGWKRGGGL